MSAEQTRAAIRAILDEELHSSTDWNGIDSDSIERAVDRLAALSILESGHQWGTRMVWAAEMGGHTEDVERNSEGDARQRVTNWAWQQSRPNASARISDFQLIRRTVGPWKVVES